MPNIGEVKNGKEIGLTGYCAHMWVACETCRKERWVALDHGEPRSHKCRSCASHGSLIPQPKGTIQNPVIDDIRSPVDFGLNHCSGLLQFCNCPKCGKGYWRTLSCLKRQKSNLCKECATLHFNSGELSNKWKGGKTVTAGGYTHVWLSSDSLYYKMVNKTGKLCEHRLVMAQHLGRCLQPFEIVHHKNGIKTDNRIENLELTISGEHSKNHSRSYIDGFIKGYREGFSKVVEEKIDKLNKEIRLLELKLKGDL
jgi:hypothetical protein